MDLFSCIVALEAAAPIPLEVILFVNRLCTVQVHKPLGSCRPCWLMLFCDDRKTVFATAYKTPDFVRSFTTKASIPAGTCVGWFSSEAEILDYGA